jgi:hypothetical protein
MDCKVFHAHHLAWLAAHPDRSIEWLRRMLTEGFHVHHIDGDHSNNHPANLALIEAVDHMRLHGLFRLVGPDLMNAGRIGGRKRWEGKSKEEISAHMRMMVHKRHGNRKTVENIKRRAKAARRRQQRELAQQG